MKSIISVSVDSELIKRARELNFNISGTFNDFLKNMIAIETEDIDGINLEIEQKELTKNEKILAKYQKIVQKSRERIQKIQQQRDEKEQERLMKEKEKIEKAKKCRYCLIDISTFDDSKTQKLKDGTICCKNCFFNNYKNIKEKGLI